MSSNSRIPYLDGFKGFTVILVSLLHYIMCFVVDSGYVGWESGIANTDKINYFWANAPLSFLANATFVLSIFFAIIAFLPAWHFFQKQDVEWIKKQAIVRYFRFVPYTLTFTLLSYAFYVNGGYFNEEVAAVINLRWPAALMQGNLSWGDALISGAFKSLWQGDGSYLSVFWCMHIIFLGSYLSYALLLFFASSKKHLYIYLIILIVSAFTLPWAMPFIGGIIVASIACNELKNPSSTKKRKLRGWFLFVMGLTLGATLDGITINSYWQDILKVISSLSVLLSLFYLDYLQKIFSHRFFISVGKYVFPLIIMHNIVMLSISSWMFVELHALYGYSIALAFTLLLGILLNAIAAVIAAKLVDPICMYLSKHAYNFFK